MKVKSLLELERFKSFKLLAGQSGLDREVSKICLLDYEIVEQIEGQFWRGEFALSSLLGAKDDPSLILKAVQYLVGSGCSGLAIKNIYYDHLPVEVIDYANEQDFPIFLFDNSVFFEDLIMDFRDVLRDLDKSRSYEQTIKRILDKRATEEEVADLHFTLVGRSDKPYRVIYFRLKSQMDEKSIIKPIERHRTMALEPVRSLIRYANGLLMVYSTEKFSRKLFNVDVGNLIDRADYWMGESESQAAPENFGMGIHQALAASEIAQAEDMGQIEYRNIGVYKLLLSLEDDNLARQFARDVIEPIIEYDQKRGTELYDTAVSFVDNDGNISEVAEDLHQHKNTIRYRINTIKKIHHMETSEGSFFEQLSLAMKIMKLKGF